MEIYDIANPYSKWMKDWSGDAPWSTTENMLSELNQWGKDACMIPSTWNIWDRHIPRERKPISGFLGLGRPWRQVMVWAPGSLVAVMKYAIEGGNAYTTLYIHVKVFNYVFLSDWVIGFVNCVSTILHGILSEICSQPNLSTEKQGSPKIASYRIATWEKRGAERQQVDCAPLVCGKN